MDSAPQPAKQLDPLTKQGRETAVQRAAKWAEASAAAREASGRVDVAQAALERLRSLLPKAEEELALARSLNDEAQADLALATAEYDDQVDLPPLTVELSSLGAVDTSTPEIQEIWNRMCKELQDAAKKQGSRCPSGGCFAPFPW